jgi:cytochrome c-type biogenesis protein CcmF
MIALAGNISLCFALFFSFMQSFPVFYSYKNNNPYLRALARPSAIGQCVFVIIAYLLLTMAFVTHDFSLAYVAAHSHPALPLMYRLAAVWGGHEGSILLWIVMLNIWTMAFWFFTSNAISLDKTLTLSLFGFINFCFLCFLFFTSNPFITSVSIFIPQDLNPLLQDPGLVIHPPMLYAGYVGFSAAFAITQAALLRGKFDSTWARVTRHFALAAWCLLTLGITLGSWWAYRVLGWGGFWFWDPVENAALLPWLSGVAFIHVLLLVEKRGAAVSWAAFLSIITFALSLLGTFLVRSGILI